jgi:hypothetical protein
MRCIKMYLLVLYLLVHKKLENVLRNNALFISSDNNKQTKNYLLVIVFFVLIKIILTKV